MFLWEFDQNPPTGGADKLTLRRWQYSHQKQYAPISVVGAHIPHSVGWGAYISADNNKHELDNL